VTDGFLITDIINPKRVPYYWVPFRRTKKKNLHRI